MRDSKEGARTLSTDSVFAVVTSHVLQSRLGVVPDPVEPWFSAKAIAEMLAIEEQTLRNRVRWTRIPRHALGKFYRLSDVVRHLNDEQEEATER